MTSRRMWLVITALGVIPAAAIGYWWGTPESEPEVTPTREFVKVVDDTLEPELPALHRGPRPPGVWKWQDLRGGECIESFESAWVEEFVVVECGAAHQAEFGRATVIDTHLDAPYPGDQALAEKASAHCERFEREELINPEQYDDLVAQSAYSLGEEAWQAGDRLMGCFISRQDGGVFTEKLLS